LVFKSVYTEYILGGIVKEHCPKSYEEDETYLRCCLRKIKH